MVDAVVTHWYIKECMMPECRRVFKTKLELQSLCDTCRTTLVENARRGPDGTWDGEAIDWDGRVWAKDTSDDGWYDWPEKPGAYLLLMRSKRNYYRAYPTLQDIRGEVSRLDYQIEYSHSMIADHMAWVALDLELGFIEDYTAFCDYEPTWYPTGYGGD